MVRQHTVLVIGSGRPHRPARVAELFQDHPKVDRCEPGDGTMRVILKAGVEEYDDLPALLINSGVSLRRFAEEELDLESAFMALTQGTSTRM